MDTRKPTALDLLRVFLPLVPYAAILLVVYLILRPFGLGWVAFVVVGTMMLGVVLYVWACRWIFRS